MFFPGLRVWITQNGLLDCFLLSEISLAFFLHNTPSQINRYQKDLVFDPDMTDWIFLDSDNKPRPSNINAKTECCSLYTADYGPSHAVHLLHINATVRGQPRDRAAIGLIELELELVCWSVLSPFHA